jgi:hypothetical protein
VGCAVQEIEDVRLLLRKLDIVCEMRPMLQKVGRTARVRSCECSACVPRVCAARQACSVRSCRRRSSVLIIVGKGTDNRNKGTDKLCQGH